MNNRSQEKEHIKRLDLEESNEVVDLHCQYIKNNDIEMVEWIRLNTRQYMIYHYETELLESIKKCGLEMIKVFFPLKNYENAIKRNEAIVEWALEASPHPLLYINPKEISIKCRASILSKFIIYHNVISPNNKINSDIQYHQEVIDHLLKYDVTVANYIKLVTIDVAKYGSLQAISILLDEYLLNNDFLETVTKDEASDEYPYVPLTNIHELQKELIHLFLYYVSGVRESNEPIFNKIKSVLEKHDISQHNLNLYLYHAMSKKNSDLVYSLLDCGAQLQSLAEKTFVSYLDNMKVLDVELIKLLILVYENKEQCWEDIVKYEKSLLKKKLSTEMKEELRNHIQKCMLEKKLEVNLPTNMKNEIKNKV